MLEIEEDQEGKGEELVGEKMQQQYNSEDHGEIVQSLEAVSEKAGNKSPVNKGGRNRGGGGGAAPAKEKQVSGVPHILL